MTTALLVIDMQNYFAPMVQGPPLDNTLTLIQHFCKLNLPRIFTQHGHPPSDLTTTTPSPNALVRKWGPQNSIKRDPNDKNWQLIPEVQFTYFDCSDKNPTRTARVDKNTYDAFVGTPLGSILEQWGVERVVVCGVMTDCCVDTTARGAFNRGWETWVVGDACGSANREQHEAGLRGFGYGFGEVLNTEEVCSRIKGKE